MLEIIAISIAVMAAGTLVGAGVQRITHFIDPIDFLTAFVVCLVPVLYWLQASGYSGIPFDTVWGWPFLAGYTAGYFVSGRVDYTMVRTYDGSKVTISRPYIFYTHNGTYYLQEQTWTALAKRLFLRIRHEVVVTNGDLTPDWIDQAKWPHFPVREHSEFIAESLETFILEPEKQTRIPRPKTFLTVITRANGSSISTAELVRDRNALAKANKQLIEAENENFSLKQSLNMRLADSVAYFLSRVYSKAPGASFLEAMKSWDKEKDKEKEDKEHGKDN